MNKIILPMILVLSLLVPTFASAQTTLQGTHTVKSGDTLWKVSQQYSVSLSDLRKVNNKYTDMLYVGETLKVPATISSYERNLLAKLVYAEAKGESYAGKVAVATVVLNRVSHSEFPNSIHGVIYEPGAFTPVASGSINNTPDSSTYRAVDEALAFKGQGSGSLFFYNPAKTSNAWIKSRPVTVIIGNHVFAK